MLRVQETEDVFPICPHCSKELRSVSCHTLESLWGKRYVYFCPECRKILGVTQRKGFWMG